MLARSLEKLPLGVTGNTPDSGSGESWFEPRRGNLKRDPRLLRVALLLFSPVCHRFCHRFSRHLFDTMSRDADLTRVAYKRFAFHVRKAPSAPHEPGRNPGRGAGRGPVDVPVDTPVDRSVDCSASRSDSRKAVQNPVLNALLHGALNGVLNGVLNGG